MLSIYEHNATPAITRQYSAIIKCDNVQIYSFASRLFHAQWKYVGMCIFYFPEGVVVHNGWIIVVTSLLSYLFSWWCDGSGYEATAVLSRRMLLNVLRRTNVFTAVRS